MKKTIENKAPYISGGASPVIIFSTAYLPLQGGAELAVKEITSRITNCEFFLICARLDKALEKKEKIGNVNVHRIGFGYKFDKILLPVFGFLRARRIYSQFPVTSSQSLILWGIMASWGSLAALVFKLFYPRVPFLLTLQEGDAESYIKKARLGLIGWSWKMLLRKADRVQVISRYLADMARGYGYAGNIDIVPNGVDLVKFQISNFKSQINPKLQITNTKNELKIGNNEKIIITVSRLVEKNGIGDLIDALPQLSVISYKLLVLGAGPLEKGLKDRAKGLGLENKVIFLGDIPNEDVPRYLAVSDVFCRPSRSEGLGTAFLEAMAAGVPVVATPVGGIPDFLTEQETGLFCEPGNPANIAERINILLGDENFRQKIILNGRKMVEEKYNWDKIARDMRIILAID
jgi:glycosyltransferase involved in cell wall biosynthesis